MEEKRPNEQLRRERDIRGWSQRALAELLGTTEQVVNHWERGSHKPNRHFQTQLCQLFGKNAEELGFMRSSQGTMEEGKARIAAESAVEASVHVLQLRLKGHLSEQEGVTRSNDSAVFWLSESEMFIPSSLQSVIPLQGGALWFVLKQRQWEDLVHFYEERVLLCNELQQELNREFRFMDEESQDQEYALSRRQALGTLIVLPLALLTQVQTKHVPLRPEEFLPRCAASITSYWKLLNNDGLFMIKGLLPTYLPTLVALAKQPSRYQRVAASLAAQGCLLMELVSYHQLRFQNALSYASQATELAHLSEEDNLRAYALLILGSAYNLHGQKRVMLEKHQEAQLSLEMVVPALQSYILAELAYSYAQNGQIQEALGCLGEARARFPESIGEVPSFVSADYSLSQLVTFEGLTHLSLGMQTTGNDALNYHTQANTMFSQIESLSAEVIIPERTRIEIINQRALTAMRMGDLEQFEQYFIQGVQGAQALGSQKRKDEAKANWREARQRWPHEKKIVDLADLLVDIF